MWSSLGASVSRQMQPKVLPFEVHDTLGDSRGGVEGRQELLSKLDGLCSEHLEGSKDIVTLGRVGCSHCKKLLVDKPPTLPDPEGGTLLGSVVAQAGHEPGSTNSWLCGLR